MLLVHNKGGSFSFELKAHRLGFDLFPANHNVKLSLVGCLGGALAGPSWDTYVHEAKASVHLSFHICP